MEQLTVRMPKEHLVRIDQIAQKTGLRKSDITRLAIKHFIEGYEFENTKSPFERARHLIGVAESGVHDLGQNHRKVLDSEDKEIVCMKAILDTGPWVALIDRSESRHFECIEWFKNFTGMLYSTEAVLTEVLYLLNFSIQAQTAAIDFVLNSIVELIPSDLDSFRSVRKLMFKYADFPMDYADATIVCLAMHTDIHHIVTFDRKDFSVYRLPNKGCFKIIPE